MPLSPSRQALIDLHQKKVDEFNIDPVGSQYRQYGAYVQEANYPKAKYTLVKTIEPAFLASNNEAYVKIDSGHGVCKISLLRIVWDEQIK